MTPQQIEQAAGALKAARKDNRMLAGLDDGLTPRSMEDGYALQDAFMRIWEEPVAGWKVGATAEKVQELYGVSEPFCGPFYVPTTFTSPAEPKARDFGHFCIESEFAFRFGSTLAARKRAYDREEILGAIEAVLPAFELISPRFDTLLQDRIALAAADCGLNGGFVLGEDYANWRGLDLAAHGVRLSVDGEVKGEGTGANALGHPFNVLDWLVNELSRRGIDLNAGEIVSTGTCTGIVFLEQGQKAVADYGVLGTIEVTFV
ncbi:2-hydroxyhexa-2,4-dienoate hydratase [bacterium BMS3Bbin10]|nr:2-hydroxyhexa-2,4-dienoate hydratase [bacterium BMS3Bbin10]